MMKKIIIKLLKKLILDQGTIINSEFLNGLEAPNESVIETIKILETKKLGKKKLTID